MDKKFEFLQNIQYQLSDIKDEPLLIFADNGFSYYINFYDLIYRDKKCPFAFKVKINADICIFAFNKNLNSPFNVNIKYQNKDVNISVGESLLVFMDGEIIKECKVCNLSYAHFQQICGKLVVFFNGKRPFLLALNSDKTCYASFYDEINFNDNELYVMCRLFDSLNHGKVIHINKEKFENYLIYLDDNELNMKPEFAFMVFLDCLLAENYNYALQLLSENFANIKAESINEFFPEFDNFYAIDNCAVLIKNNTLAGVFKFEMLNDKIDNIIEIATL